jgi:hypothetical protein
MIWQCLSKTRYKYHKPQGVFELGVFPTLSPLREICRRDRRFAIEFLTKTVTPKFDVQILGKDGTLSRDSVCHSQGLTTTQRNRSARRNTRSLLEISEVSQDLPSCRSDFLGKWASSRGDYSTNRNYHTRRGFLHTTRLQKRIACPNQSSAAMRQPFGMHLDMRYSSRACSSFLIWIDVWLQASTRRYFLIRPITWDTACEER